MRTLSNAVTRGKVHHAYLFVGSRGTGKTSMAKILAACLNCVDGPTISLTPREEEVVKLIAEAYTNAQIAEILHLAEKTVESHRANVLRKLGMRDRVELVRYAIRRGLVEA